MAGTPWRLVVLTAGVGLGILAFAPNYLEVQRADDAAVFRSLVSEYGEVRVGVAAALDLVFAPLYAATCFAFFGGRRRHAVGRWLVVVGAVFDELENVWVLLGVRDPDSLTDATVEWTRRFGGAKSITLVLGVAALIGASLVERRAGSDASAEG